MAWRHFFEPCLCARVKDVARIVQTRSAKFAVADLENSSSEGSGSLSFRTTEVGTLCVSARSSTKRARVNWDFLVERQNLQGS